MNILACDVEKVWTDVAINEAVVSFTPTLVQKWKGISERSS